MPHRHGCFTKSRLAGFVTAGLMLAAAVSAYAQAPVTPPGSGTAGDPYLISQLGHLVWMGDNVGASSGKYYSLTADIDASATAGWNDAGTETDVLEGFKPIGTLSSPNTMSFLGVFDGNGHTIRGLVINRPTADYVGLFGYVGSTGQVRNVGMVGGAAKGRDYVGGLVGHNYYATVSNCYATGAITGTGNNVGGLVGYSSSGTVSNCYATGAVTGTGSYVGGLVGSGNYGTVSNSYWDMQTSGQSSSAGGTGKTTAEMKQQATFAGWDFAGVWGIVEGTSYPYLRSSPPPFKLKVDILGPGSVTVDPPSADGTYAPGTLVTLTAVPSGPTDVFIRWAGAVPGESSTATVVMDIHRLVTAVFGPRIEINSLADLAKIGSAPGYPLVDVLYVLTTDIDASATAGWNDAGTDTTVLEGFKPIGTYSSPDTTSFRGVFDGNGHTISGLVINRPATDDVGLFGRVNAGGQVQNLGLAGGAVTGNSRVGGLVGSNSYGTIFNCCATGAATGKRGVGGLVGGNSHGTVSNCCATGVVTGQSLVGGLVGSNSYDTVSNCCATGTVTGSDSVGGLVGSNYQGTVSNGYATGAVIGEYYVGGLVGVNSSGTISNSYWDMETSGGSTSDGGTSKTTTEMKQQATFAGWDFTSVWGIIEGTSYPYLRSSPPPFKLTVNITGPGSVTVDPPSADGTYAPGTQVTLTPVPDGSTAGFIRWAGVAPSEPPTLTLVMDIHRSVTAVFGPRIEINSLTDLAKIGNDPGYSLADALYVLTADMDASATAGWNDAGTSTDRLEGFNPIGTYSDTTSFRGVFDGNGHTISGLVINRPTTNYVGLFGRMGPGGLVRNLGMVGGAVTGRYHVGGLVGFNSFGTVSHAYATGAVTGSNRVGGLVGYDYYGTVSHSYATGAATGTQGNVGGLVGYIHSGSISNCYATGAVTGSSYSVGGLFGYSDSGNISNCYATGAVSGSTRYVFGLGYTGSGNTSNSYWDMQTSGQSGSPGGPGKTTAEMKQQATFAGWDFTGVWGIVEGTTYPYLRSSPPPFKLTVSISGPGSVTVEPPSADGTYPAGTVVTLTAAPSEPTDAFLRWAGAAPSESPTVTVVMDVHRSITAVFGPRIEINSLADLAKIGTGYPLADVLYVLTADIDASATAGWNDAGTDTTVLEGFKPIGIYSDPDTTSFRGIFDGNGHTISALVVNRRAIDYMGLFRVVGTGGAVRNLGLVGGTVTGSSYVGGLVGYNNSGTVSNCYATAAVTGFGYVGGLVGSNGRGTVSGCHATNAVTGTSPVGGLVGYNELGTVSNCYAAGAVTGSDSVGGLVGSSPSGTVSNCYAAGAVRGYSGVGGLLAYTYSCAVLNSYWDTQTTGQSTSAGGTGKTTAEMKQQATFAGWDFATLWGITENVTYPFLRSPVATDFDRDRDVDIDDFLDFKDCFNGPNRPIKTGCTVAADLDGDTDVDLMDFAIFRACFNGSNRPPNCP